MTLTPSKARTIPLVGWLNTPDADVMPATMHWPAKEPADVLDYSVDLSAWLADGGDTVLQVTGTPLSTAPGDITINPPLIIAGGLVTNWLAFGQGGAGYEIEYQVLTAMSRTLVFRVTVPVLSGLPQPPIPPDPPTPAIWQLIVGGITAAGTDQATATPLPAAAWMAVVNTVPPGTGVRLTQIAAVRLLNRGVNTLAVYPMLGATIEGFGQNSPALIAPGGEAGFYPTSPTQFYAAA